MTLNKILLCLFIPGLIKQSPISAQEPIHINWQETVSLPADKNGKPSIGVAGAFSGMNNGVLLIAGGANFPEQMPWMGGKKAYHDEIFILKETQKGRSNWVSTGLFTLQQPIAYGASVSTKYGIVCIGGEGQGSISSKTFLLKWDEEKQQIIQRSLPDLPFPLTNAAAASIGSVVYIAGGETPTEVSDKFLCLDLGSPSPEWKLLPSIPHAVSHTVLVAGPASIKNSLFLLGGRKKNANGISELYTEVYCYDPVTKQWKQKASLPYAISAGTGLAAGKNSVLLLGGDKGLVFHQTEELISAISLEKDELKKKMLIDQKASLQSSHPGFSHEILQYDTRTNKWTTNSKVDLNIPVTTNAVLHGTTILIPGGEIRAGVRSPWILKGNFKNKGHE